MTTVSNRGKVTLDVERPVLIEVSEDRLVRLKGIDELVSQIEPNNASAEDYGCYPRGQTDFEAFCETYTVPTNNIQYFLKYLTISFFSDSQ